MIRVLIVTEVRLYGEALAQWLERRGSVRVAGTTGNREEALARIQQLLPDVALVDIPMPGSLETARAMVDLEPELKVVAIGLEETEQNVLACAEAGFAGYVPREASLNDLAVVIEGAACGELQYSPRVAATLLRRLASLVSTQGAGYGEVKLTAREVEMVQLIDQGLSNKEIARRLSIEVATVKNHVHNILEKVRVHRRSEAAARLRGHLARRRSELRAPTD